jgi:signal transduction histidine kinase
MSPELTGPIFEPYLSDDGKGGVRLRLASVYAFVKSAGGHVDVTSSGDVGATFRMHLPLGPGT